MKYDLKVQRGTVQKQVIKGLYICLLAAVSFFPQAEQILKIGYDEVAPFRFTNGNNQAVGYDINRVSAILDAANIQYRFYPSPWKRTLRDIELGRLDMALSAGKIKGREAYALFSTSVFNVGLSALFVRNDYASDFSDFSALSDLNNMKVLIGVRRGASYSDEYDALLQEPLFVDNLVNLNDTDQAIRMAMTGRIQGLIASDEDIEHKLKELCLQNQFSLIYDLSQSEEIESFLMFSKKTVSADIVKRIDDAMLAVDSPSDKYKTSVEFDYPDCSSLRE